MKRFLIILVVVAVMAYLLFWKACVDSFSSAEMCQSFDIIIKDSVESQFLQSRDIEQMIKKEKLYPVGKTFGEINTLMIHDAIMENKLVESVDVYSTSRGNVVASIRQRKPILRVVSTKTKKSFYIDKKCEVMPVTSNFAVYVPIATGAIDEEFAKNELYDFAIFLNRNDDWNAWIEQIVVTENQEVKLIPRAGDFAIVMGTLDDYQAKLAKFALFIEKGLNVVGWNRYSEINLKYDNQIVCKKK